MSLFGNFKSKVQETAIASKLLATMKRGKEVSGQILEAYVKKDFEKVLALFESVLVDEPLKKQEEIYAAVGLMALSGKNFTVAKKCFEKALDYTQSGKNYAHMGHYYFESEAYPEAIDQLSKALEKDFHDESVYMTLMEIYKRTKAYKNLIDIIWKYIQRFNKPNWLWENSVQFFNQESLTAGLNKTSPGTALLYVLMLAKENEPAEKVIELSEQLSSQPFPIFSNNYEKASYHWVRAICYSALNNHSKCADEWYGISTLSSIQENILTQAKTEWKAHELSAHFDPEILRRIHSKDTLSSSGQFMKATLLFCDIRGFSRFSYEFRHAPQVILQFLQPYFDQSQDIIANHKGILDKYLGDGFIAFFIPEDQDEQAYYESVMSSLKSAIELQAYFMRNLPKWSDIWKKNLDETSYHQSLVDQIGLGLGIHTGFVFIGEVGTKKRKQFTALGNVVNFSARLQGKAKKNHIVFSAPIYEYVKEANLGFTIQEMPEDNYSDLKNIPGSYKLYFIDCNKP